MKTLLSLFVVLLSFTLGAQEGKAQWSFANFAATNNAQAFAVMFTNGASSQYYLRYNVATNGVISGSAVRYDFSTDSASASPTTGKRVTILSQLSRLGYPIKVMKVYLTTLRSAFSVKLSDGAVIKGAMESNVGLDIRNSSSMEGVITYKGGLGSTLSLSNPY